MKIRFPYEGIDKGRALCEQPEMTVPHMNNMRPRDVLDNRMRGGQRPGLDKWSATQIGAAEQPVVCMVVVSSVQ